MLELVFPFDSFLAAETAIECLELLGDQRGRPFTEVNLYHDLVELSALKRKLKLRKSFLLDGPGFEMHMASVGNSRLSFLKAEGIDSGSEGLWVQRFNDGKLVLGRLYDKEYNFWQNAEDPLEYKTRGRSMDGLPKKRDGMPPIDRMVVDTSGNPGRRILRNGYVEAIGHRMWLGPEFFPRVPGSDRQAILADSEIEVRDLDGGILEILAHPEPFIDASTIDIQNHLRRLLFPTTA